MTGPANGEARFEIRAFRTTVAELKQARAWITGDGSTDVITSPQPDDFMDTTPVFS
jgi:hypothetical protein